MNICHSYLIELGFHQTSIIDNKTKKIKSLLFIQLKMVDTLMIQDKLFLTRYSVYINVKIYYLVVDR